jgi:hypothetical protein
MDHEFDGLTQVCYANSGYFCFSIFNELRIELYYLFSFEKDIFFKVIVIIFLKKIWFNYIIVYFFYL